MIGVRSLLVVKQVLLVNNNLAMLPAISSQRRIFITHSHKLVDTWDKMLK